MTKKKKKFIYNTYKSISFLFCALHSWSISSSSISSRSVTSWTQIKQSVITGILLRSASRKNQQSIRCNVILLGQFSTNVACVCAYVCSRQRREQSRVRTAKSQVICNQSVTTISTWTAYASACKKNVKNMSSSCLWILQCHFDLTLLFHHINFRIPVVPEKWRQIWFIQKWYCALSVQFHPAVKKLFGVLL